MRFSSAKYGKERITSKKTIKLTATTRKDVLEKVFDQNANDVYRFCMRRVRDHHTAEDLVSITFLDLTRDIEKFNGQSEEAVRCWLFAAVRNKVNAHFRKNIRRKEIFLDVIEERKEGCIILPSGDSDRRLDWPVFQKAMEKLNPRYRELITMRYFDELEPKEMAKILGEKPGNIRGTLSRAVGKLREYVREAFNEGNRKHV